MERGLKAAVEKFHYALIPQETNKAEQKDVFSYKNVKGVKSIKEEQAEHFKQVEVEEGKVEEVEKEKEVSGLDKWGI